ncbi:ABC transporter permease [Saccharicrinis sp. GN24d3]|uniref:ABC transporter permease n=1 Tax=Saccharicrinis sp. GN24d3 TaxID=3458416 RepID=UPI0040353F42
MQFLKEIKHRKGNFLLTVMAVSVAVALVVVFVTMTKASQNETRRLTRDMGFNLRIVPGQTDMNHFWVSGYSNMTMSGKNVDKLVDAKAIYYAHLTATLHKKIIWRDHDVVLTGISSDEKEPKGSIKSKMIFGIAPDKVYVGYEIAKSLEIAEGDQINVLGKLFQVQKVLAEVGSEDDIHLYFDLPTLQKLLKMEGRINEIMALNCLCSTGGDDPLEALRTQLIKILPDTKVIMNRTIAVARERQRKMVNAYFAWILPLVIIICAFWVGGMTLLNTMHRRHEIGTLRAIGMGAGAITNLFIQRALLAGFIGALIGFSAGTILSLTYGPDIFKVTAKAIKPLYYLLWWSFVLAPFFSVIASMIPIVHATGLQPANILKEE